MTPWNKRPAEVASGGVLIFGGDLNGFFRIARLEAQRIFGLTSKVESSEAIQAIQGMAQSVLDRLFSLYGMTREIVKRLRPEVIDTLGLRDAVKEMIRQYNSPHATCVFEFHAVGDFSDLRGDLQYQRTGLFRKRCRMW